MSMVILLAMLLLQIISLVGLFYLTQFSFQHEKTGNNRSIELSNNNILFCKIAVVLQWIVFGVTALGVLQRYV